MGRLLTYRQHCLLDCPLCAHNVNFTSSNTDILICNILRYMIWYDIWYKMHNMGVNNTSLIAIFVLTSSNTTHSEHIKYIDEITIPYQPWYQEIWLRTAICIFTTYQKVNEMFVCCNNISKGQMIGLCFPQFHSTLYNVHSTQISSFFSLVPHHTQSKWNQKRCRV